VPAVILAVLEDVGSAACVLAAAGHLAELTRAARISVLAVRTPPIETILPSEEILTREREIQIRAVEAQRADTLRAVYTNWTSNLAASAINPTWADIEGPAGQIVAEYGERADYILIKRPRPRDLDSERKAMHASLFDSDRPVLVVPPEQPPAQFGRCVAIAWRDDNRTIKSVLAALRWLPQAERIHVLAGFREGALRPTLPEILIEHGISAELHLLPITGQDAFGALLLAKSHELTCDMIVLGAFARHPARSLIFGGVTRHMLAYADLPVFMRH
jgi:nucleotide-binding universal stress UspA family protein